MKRLVFSLAILSLLISTPSVLAKKSERKANAPAAAEEKKDILSAETFKGLELRNIGPAMTSGRIIDIAVDPRDSSRYFVASASGGVWKTINAGTTFTPVFDDAGSYSIGCVAIAPSNPLIVWIGTGENNSQRSVGYGDGIYKSVDGGNSFQKMGLETSEHIGKILIDPRNADVVYVASQGPLWRAGGERGVFKTTDGGKTFKQVLEISEDTGASDMAFDPRNPDVIYATAYQRRRRTWTLIDGGPESAIYKSLDGGKNWDKIIKGLPEVELGRIGLAVAPSDPDRVYALVEAAEGKSGFFRSLDAGQSWERRSDYASTSPQYYQELIVDPLDADRVYSMDTWMMVTLDGGASFEKVGEKAKHVDNHALWIDPEDTRHLLAGCDGGTYESFDRGASWSFMANLPVTQFYKITADNDFPFYNIYGGTQDNATLGGPARNKSLNGITNADWYVTVFGDGFKTVVDPTNPDTVYSQWQYGGLVRYDRQSGESIDIQPQPGPDDAPLEWNWSSALIISPHSPTRLYFGANRLFRSDDRGNSWQGVSPDLTRQIDRNQLEVMGKLWSVDAVAKNTSTSFFGTIVSLSESPLVEGLIYAGTDDGLVQVTEDGGKNWRKIETFPGVPEMSYIDDLEASLHDAGTVFAVLNNHKSGDFKPYILESNDRGRSWHSITGDLPERGSVYSIAQDEEQPDLLFAGTEFGLWFTVDRGNHWTELTGGMPTIAARDLDIQRREHDLVVGTFGRGAYVLDDYTPLREITRERLQGEPLLFPVRQAWMFMPEARFGLTGKAFQGDSFFTAPNPPFGAVFTYYLPEDLQTLEQQRREREKKLTEEGKPIPYPSWEQLRAEAREPKPKVILSVRDSEGNLVRRISGPATKGFHRVAWDLRYPPATPTRLEPPPENPFESGEMGPLAAPGAYSVSLATFSRGKLVSHGEAQPFGALPLTSATLPAADLKALVAFEKKTARLQRAVLGAVKSIDEASKKLDYLEQASFDTPAAGDDVARRILELRDRLKDLRMRLTGDPVLRAHQEPVRPGLVDRVQRIVSGHWTATSAPTETHRRNYAIAAAEFGDVLAKLDELVGGKLERLEEDLERAGAPWTPGRLPRWTPEAP